MIAFEDTQRCAIDLDASDPLKDFRDDFHLPKGKDGEPLLYFTGNSLGLQPKRTAEVVNQVLKDWAALGVHGHFDASRPWMPYHEFLTDAMARVVGALPEEVVVMNSLTVNLHLMMATFFRPEGRRTRIAIERHAFPSDRYAVRSHLAWHGLDPDEHLLILGNGDVLNEEEIERILAEEGDTIALLLIGGVNYYSGQLFDMKRIARAAHAADVRIGFDLAHAAGNVTLKLHDWKVDFAAWCSYKYLNSGPGGPSAVFIHQRHAENVDLPRLAGWWGQKKETRFEMPERFTPIPTAEGWQLSNPPILALAALKASLDVFDEAGMGRLIAKSRNLTGFFDFLLRRRLGSTIEIITPESRGAQLSLRVPKGGRQTFRKLEQAGAVCDWREPDIIRVAPVPLYNSFQDVYRFVGLLEEALAS